MPDITMCVNKECPWYYKCYRAQAVPNEYQSYAKFTPEKDNKCIHFSPIRGTKNEN